MKKIIIKYSISIVFASLLVILCLWLRDITSVTDLKEKYRLLADSFSIPGLFLVLLGALIALSNEGALDGISYMLKRLGNALIPFAKKTDQKFYDYVKDKKRVSGYAFILYTGLLFLGIGILFIVLFYTV